MTGKSFCYWCTFTVVQLIVILHYFFGFGLTILAAVFIIPYNWPLFAIWLSIGLFSVFLGSILLAGALTRKTNLIVTYLVITTILLIFLFGIFMAVVVKDPNSPFLVPLAALMGCGWLGELCVYRFYQNLSAEGVGSKKEGEKWDKLENVV